MRISIIVPTCNRNDALAICLEQLLVSLSRVQEIQIEVIVTDDGLQTNARALISEKYQWVTWLDGPKRGPAANRNNGAKLAKGDWFIFLDDDCIPHELILSEYIKVIHSSTNVEVFEGSILPDGEKKSSLDYAPINLTGGNLWSCNFCISRRLFFEIGAFDERFIYPHMEDIDLKVRLTNIDKQIQFVPNASVVHPWRRLARGYKLGIYQEMYLFFHIKHNKAYSMAKLMFDVTLFYRSMWNKTTSINELNYLVTGWIQHLWVVLTHWASWKRKYLSIRAKSNLLV